MQRDKDGRSDIKREREINRGRDRYKGITLCEPAPGGFLTAWTMFLSLGLCARVCVCVTGEQRQCVTEQDRLCVAWCSISPAKVRSVHKHYITSEKLRSFRSVSSV